MASLRINLTRPREDHEEDEVLGEDFEHNDPWVSSPTGPPSPSTISHCESSGGLDTCH
jgi:hypothetical protein